MISTSFFICDLLDARVRLRLAVLVPVIKKAGLVLLEKLASAIELPLPGAESLAAAAVVMMLLAAAATPCFPGPRSKSEL